LKASTAAAPVADDHFFQLNFDVLVSSIVFPHLSAPLYFPLLKATLNMIERHHWYARPLKRRKNMLKQWSYESKKDSLEPAASKRMTETQLFRIILKDESVSV